VLLLREADGDRYLPIGSASRRPPPLRWSSQGVEPPRPLTHDLIRDLIAALGHFAQRGANRRSAGRHFYADLIFDRNIKVSARPSELGGDRAAGWRSDLRRGGRARPGRSADPDESDEEPNTGVREDEVEKFKEFLDSVSPDDFKAT